MNVLFLFYLIGLSILGFVATDMYLPAFSAMKSDLSTQESYISASMTLFLAGFASAQLLWGWLSDSLGRKPTLLIGLGLFVITSLGIAITDNVYIMLSLRFIQAIGVCAAAVSWQALVMDYYPANETGKIFASVMPLVALSPALAPLIGAFLVDKFSWRAIFMVLAVLGTILWIGTACLKKSSNNKVISFPKQSIPEPSKLEQFIADYSSINSSSINTSSTDNSVSTFQLLKTMLQNKSYQGNVLIYSVCSASFFAWLTASPFILRNLSLDETEIGLAYVPQTVCFLIGGYLCKSLMLEYSNRKLLRIFLIIYSFSMIWMFLSVIYLGNSLLALLAPLCLMAFANSAIYPNAVALALKPFSNDSGVAVGLQNTVQLACCFLASALVSIFVGNVLLATSIIMLSTVLFAWLGFLKSKS